MARLGIVLAEYFLLECFLCTSPFHASHISNHISHSLSREQALLHWQVLVMALIYEWTFLPLEYTHKHTALESVFFVKKIQ